MPKSESETVWYVGADHAGKRVQGFTANPEAAFKDRNGNPILCPADMSRVWKAQFRRDRAKVEAIWEMLLDEMAVQVELDSEDRVGYDKSEARQLALAEALSALTGQSVIEIRIESGRRYDQSAEG